jgi:hypothetical protein
MKYIGFLKEYNQIAEATGLQQMKQTEANHDTDKILQYLNQGALLFAWMGYVSDIETKALISPDAYYTDGVWVWPSYFLYYLGKYPKMKIEHEFIEYLQERNYEFMIDPNFHVSRGKMERDLLHKLDPKFQ